MAKVMIMAGHGTDSTGRFDSGCVYKTNGVKYTEAALMLPITKAAAKYLRASGVTVYTDSDSGNNKNVITGVQWEHNVRPDIFISVHCDYDGSPSGVYPLVYPTSTKGKKLATYLNDTIKADMGMKSRGIAGRSDLYELAETLCPAVVLECGSIKQDLTILKNKPDQYGKAIAKGICKYLGVTFKDGSEPAPAPAVTVKSVNYMVRTNSTITLYSDYKGTKKSTVSGVYTIIQESSNGYGKLKSGAGWIKLSDTTKYQAVTKTTTDKFIDTLDAYGKEIEASFKYSNTNSKTTWAEAKKNHIVNCARYVSWALQAVGILPSGKCIYCTTSLLGTGAATIKSSSKVTLSKPGKTTISMAKAGQLKRGDIVMYTNGKHTMVVRDVNKTTGVVHYYTAGSSDVGVKNVRNRRRAEYDSRKVSYLIRIK